MGGGGVPHYKQASVISAEPDGGWKYTADK